MRRLFVLLSLSIALLFASACQGLPRLRVPILNPNPTATSRSALPQLSATTPEPVATTEDGQAAQTSPGVSPISTPGRLTPRAVLPGLGVGGQATPPSGQAEPSVTAQAPASEQAGQAENRAEGPCVAKAEIVASAAQVKVGEAVTVTVTLANQDCDALGPVIYHVNVASRNWPIPLEPVDPAAVVRAVGPAAGEAGTAGFVLHATHPGDVTLAAAVTYEVSSRQGRSATWSGASSAPVAVQVTR
jgi:hypothetical protein